MAKKPKITDRHRRISAELKASAKGGWYPTPAQVRDYEQRRTNYMDRRRTQIRKYEDRFGEDTEMELTNSLVIGGRMGTIREITTKEGFDRAMSAMVRDKTTAGRAGKLKQMKSVLKTSIGEGYGFGLESREWREIASKIDSMSAEQVIALRLDNPEFVVDFFDLYHAQQKEGYVMDGDELAKNRKKAKRLIDRYSKMRV